MFSPSKIPQCTPSPAALDIVPYIPSPINRNGRASLVQARNKLQKKRIPPNALTCLQVKALEEESINSRIEDITICQSCGLFELEKFDHRLLRRLKDNNPLTNDVPAKYKCTTLWLLEAAKTNVTDPPSTMLVQKDSCDSHQRQLFSNSNESTKITKKRTKTPPQLFSNSNESTKVRKKTMKTRPPDSALSSPIVRPQHKERNKLEQLCAAAITAQQASKEISGAFLKLTQCNKRQMDEIVLQQRKMQKLQKSCDVMNNDKQKLSAEKEELLESVRSLKATVVGLRKENSLLSEERNREQKRLEREAYERSSTLSPARKFSSATGEWTKLHLVMSSILI